MTLVKMVQKGGFFSVSANGHTDPRVCAAVSCLFCTAAEYIATQSGIEQICIRLDPAASRLLWRGSFRAEFLYEFLKTGFVQMRDAYPQDLALKIF